MFAQELYKNLMEREALLFEENKALQAALYLDPRFRRIMVQIRPNYFDVTQAQQDLLTLYKHMKKLEVRHMQNIYLNPYYNNISNRIAR